MNQAPRFETEIKPLFREHDRESMIRSFDLWSHEDVSQHADVILTRLQAGDMRMVHQRDVNGFAGGSLTAFTFERSAGFNPMRPSIESSRAIFAADQSSTVTRRL